MLWIVIDQLKIAIVVAALAMPGLGLMFGMWWSQRPHVLPPSARLGCSPGSGCLFGLLTVPVLLFFAFCTPPPGEGVEARDGRARGAVIIAALDQYRAMNGTYPDSLRDLVPQWLPADALAGPAHRRTVGYPFLYERLNSSYQLTFKYVGPGMNECTIESTDRSWRCHGYY